MRPRLSTALLAVSVLVTSRAVGSPEPVPPKLRLPAVAAPVSYAVRLTIDPSKPTFRGAVDVEVRLAEATKLLWMHGADLESVTVTAKAAGEAAPARALPEKDEFLGIAFDRPVGPGALSLHFEYSGKLFENSTQGLFHQKDGEDWYAFSQLEATDARRAFPCFDEPSYKVPWQLTLEIPKGTTAVSNTPIESESDGPGGSRVVRFRRTEPIPAYLVALGVGPFEYVDAGRVGKNKTPVRIVTPRGKSAQARFAAETTGPILELLESYFGTAFPYAKLDQLSIPQTVSFGAMENAGLITWAESILLAPPAEETAGFKRIQASINAHEMAHQWFGDLVTLAWWDDVWLNESFATWMADRTMQEWKPEWRWDVDRVVDRSNVMADDTLVSARKIRQEISSSDDIANAFDSISYQKGAAVLTMFESWIGADAFRTGVRDYIAAHRNGNATVKDFLGAIEKASRPGVSKAFSSFLDQAGVPLVEVSLDCAGAGAGGRSAPNLALTQKRLLPVGSPGSAPETWEIPVCSRAGTGGAGGAAARSCSLFESASGAVPAPTASCPSWVLANEGEKGYYRALYRDGLLTKLLSAPDAGLTLPERVGILRDVDALAVAGAMPMGDALALAPRYANDPSRFVVQATIRIVDDARRLVPRELEPNYSRLLSKLYGEKARALGFIPGAGDDEDTRILRGHLVPWVTEYGQEPRLRDEAKRLAIAWLDDRKAIAPELARDALEVAAHFGDRALFDRYLAGLKAAKDRRDRRRIYYALGAFEEPALLKQALALYIAPDHDPREAQQVVVAALQSETGRRVIWDFLKANYDTVVERAPRESQGQIPSLASGFCDAEHRADVASFFQDRAPKLLGGARTLAQSLEEIDLCIALKREQAPSVVTFLRAW
jgi:alanyl aminopeptidase